MFHCKLCTEKAGKVYSGDVHILKPASSNVSIELNVAEMSTEEIAEEIKPLLTPPKRRMVDYSLSSTEDSVDYSGGTDCSVSGDVDATDPEVS